MRTLKLPPKYIQKIRRRLLKWMGFVVLFAVIPFGFVYWERSEHFHRAIDWSELWPHGELGLVCMALAADGLSDIVFAKKKSSWVAVGGLGCALVLVVATYLYTKAETLPATDKSNIADYSVASMWVFGITLAVAALCKILAED